MQNYSRAPFWKTYGPALEEILSRPWVLLIDLNLALIEFLWSAFGIATPTRRASTLGVSGKKSELLLDICRKTGATVYLSGPRGKDYLDESLFSAAGISVEYHEFRHPQYSQRFSPFVEGMAGIDLLLNEGPDGIRRLEETGR
jgi:hypothetical protein